MDFPSVVIPGGVGERAPPLKAHYIFVKGPPCWGRWPFHSTLSTGRFAPLIRTMLRIVLSLVSFSTLRLGRGPSLIRTRLRLVLSFVEFSKIVCVRSTQF